MTKPVIAVFDAKSYDIKSFNAHNKPYGYELRFFEHRLNEDTVETASGADVVCVFVNDAVTEKVVLRLKEMGVQLVALRCAGYNNVDLKTTYGKLHVVRVPAYSPYAVAEHTLALIMSLNRKTHKAYNRTRENNFSLSGLLGFDLHGKTIGVVGTGKIGRIFVDMMKGFGMTRLAYDPFPNEDWAKETGVEYVSLDELYARSDIVTLNCPLTPETEWMINEESIAKMKDGVMIINTGRGRLINSQALIAGLKSGKVGSAGLDVYEEEGEFFFEDVSDRVMNDDRLARLLSFNNVLVTSHQAFFTQEALDAIASTTFENVKAHLNDKVLENEICYRCEAGCKRKEGKPCF